MYQYGEKRHWPIAVAAVALIIVYLSIQSQSRLTTKPPPQYFAPEPGQEQNVETQMGLAYWECARTVIQSKFHYGQMLPNLPPPEFTLANDRSADVPLDRKQRARMRYWEKLRSVWLLPESWDHSYFLDFSWFPRGVERLRKFGPSPKIGALARPERQS